MPEQQVHGLLDPSGPVLVLIDYQPQMFFGVQSVDRGALINNAVGLAKSARAFGVPVVLTSVAAKDFSGPFLPEIVAEFPGQQLIDRTTMNAWEDTRVVDAVRNTGRKKVVLAGLWTEVCIVLPAILAIQSGYEVYVVADACGGVSAEAHATAMQRMVQAGAAPITWLQFLLELQRDWSRQETYGAVMDIVRAHGGAYGQGILYAETMVSAHAGK
jgi:nicotinamidase-related amidase